MQARELDTPKTELTCLSSPILMLEIETVSISQSQLKIQSWLSPNAQLAVRCASARLVGLSNSYTCCVLA